MAPKDSRSRGKTKTGPTFTLGPRDPREARCRLDVPDGASCADALAADSVPPPRGFRRIPVTSDLHEVLVWLTRLDRESDDWARLVRQSALGAPSRKHAIIEVGRRACRLRFRNADGEWRPANRAAAYAALLYFQKRLVASLLNSDDIEAFSKCLLYSEDGAWCFRGSRGNSTRPSLHYVLAFMILRAGALDKTARSRDDLREQTRTKSAREGEIARLADDLSKLESRA